MQARPAPPVRRPPALPLARQVTAARPPAAGPGPDRRPHDRAGRADEAGRRDSSSAPARRTGWAGLGSVSSGDRRGRPGVGGVRSPPQAVVVTPGRPGAAARAWSPPICRSSPIRAVPYAFAPHPARRGGPRAAPSSRTIAEIDEGGTLIRPAPGGSPRAGARQAIPRPHVVRSDDTGGRDRPGAPRAVRPSNVILHRPRHGRSGLKPAPLMGSVAGQPAARATRLPVLVPAPSLKPRPALPLRRARGPWAGRSGPRRRATGPSTNCWPAAPYSSGRGISVASP